MPGFFSKLLSPPCKQKDISSEKTTNTLTRTLAGSLLSCSPTLWGTEEGVKYRSVGKFRSMGKVWVCGGKFYFKAYFVLFLFFSTSSGLCMTPDLSISRKSVKDAMVQEEEDRTASGFRVT